ncbi:MAG: UDP-2,3-diacylglucosamine diphosphatase [Deltaproteobacteria bacterium]
MTNANSNPHHEALSQTDTIIVSDIHLGSDLSRAEELKLVLESWTFERLILLGDVFDSLNLGQMSKLHWDFISYIKQLSRRKEVVWIEGNHDEGLRQVIPTLLGIKSCIEYSWEYKGKKYLAMHGHQFDDFIKNNSILTEAACLLHRLARRIDSKKYVLSRYLDRKSTTLFDLSKKVAASAVGYALGTGASYVFCGHTHEAMSMQAENVHYYNAGCWTDTPSNYISIGDGGVRLHQME